MTTPFFTPPAFELYDPTYGPITLEEHNYREHEKRRAAAIRPHCEQCGRFVPKSSLRQVLVSWDWQEYEQSGICSKHGAVGVVWMRA